ncbi:MAG: DUF3604 domain-containing protein [Proteobacteria bacterium]|nr:DUF3604 domain-containing protein [Pseudomonadota bacterium]
MADQVYWGDAHLNLHAQHIPSLEQVFAEAREHLDFLPIAYYPYDFVTIARGLRSETIGLSERARQDWERVREVVGRFNEPGRFVTFPGYEWHGDRRSGGDHNVFYFEDGPLALPDTLSELYQHCHAAGAIAIPHHTAYRAGAGGRGKVWEMHDEELSPVVEIYSSHGCSEAVGAPLPMSRNSSMGPRVSGGTVREGLAKGHRLGIIASGDTHSGCPGVWNHGLAGVWAEELTREAIWEALRQRRVYGVTGDRIVVDFQVAGAPMGSEIQESTPLEISGSVVGEAAVDRVELLRSSRVVATYCHADTWDTEPKLSPVRAKLRIAVGWGPTAEYGFEQAECRWEGRLRIDGGEILGVSGCFTRLGQRHCRVAGNEWEWQLTTSGRGDGAENIQALVFEVVGAADSRISLEVDGAGEQFTLAEALQTSRVVPRLDEARRELWDQFQLKPEDIPSPDLLYHNAHKIKVHRAVPEAAYRAAFSFRDEAPPGRNCYYLRVTQTNGQMAWTSPVWVEV